MTAAAALLAGLACGAAGEPLPTPAAPEGVPAEAHAGAVRLIQMQTFFSLPEEHRAEIIREAEARGIELPMSSGDLVETDPGVIERSEPLSAEDLDAAYTKVSHVVSREAFESFRPIHQRMLASFVDVVKTHEVPVSPCFAPGTDPELIAAFEAIVFGPNPMLFQQTTRWGATALDPGSTGVQGTPTILTYSFPSDGLSIPSGVGEPVGPNGLNAFMDSIYGNRATWRAIYDDMFAQWGSLAGNTYILEPNDDNAPFFTSPGVAGVRGDLRMGGKPIDGNSGTLAYNFFPQNGDMVVDSPDSFYNNTLNNSIRLRNVLSHEHGHGQGMLHVCPLGSILMNPFINTAFSGPQYDDVLNAHRHYGDVLEPNDSTGAATNLGSLGNGQSVNVGGTGPVGPGDVEWVSVDDDSDSDFYRVEVTGAAASITVLASPVGFEYLQGPQTGPCDTGTNYTPLFFGNLRVTLYNAGGAPIVSVNDTAAGSAETLVANVTPGVYFVEVDNTGQNMVQAYRMDISVGNPVTLPLTVDLLTAPPTLIAPATAAGFTVLVTLNDDTITDGPTLNVRPQGAGSFTPLPLSPLGGGVFSATIPGQLCGDDPDFFVSVTGSVAGTLTLPGAGFFSATIGTGFSVTESGENSMGLTVAGTITAQTAGQWTDGAPENNNRDDPPADFDGNGLAWFTGQSTTTTNTDVDAGTTILLTPVFDFTDGGTVSYAYWAADSTNPLDEATDGLRFDVSLNGGSTWTTVRDYGTANQWFTDSVDVGAEVGASSTARFRWVATEEGAGDVFEAAIDAIAVTSFSCMNPDTCDNPADVNGDGDVTPADFSAWVTAFNSQAPGCDQNGDGLCTPADFSAWVANFNVGCP
jgi:hypothetical protein